MAIKKYSKNKRKGKLKNTKVKIKQQELQEIYKIYRQKIDDIVKKQYKIIEEFCKELEKRKIEELKNQL